MQIIKKIRKIKFCKFVRGDNLNVFKTRTNQIQNVEFQILYRLIDEERVYVNWRIGSLEIRKSIHSFSLHCGLRAN